VDCVSFPVIDVIPLYDNNDDCVVLQSILTLALGASQQVVYSEVCLLHHLGGFQPAHNLRGFFLSENGGMRWQHQRISLVFMTKSSCTPFH